MFFHSQSQHSKVLVLLSLIYSFKASATKLPDKFVVDTDKLSLEFIWQVYAFEQLK